jgi:thiol-disulfide isomerase/thioredoxin
MTALRDLTPPELDELLAKPNPRLLLLYLWGPDCPNCEIFKRQLPNLLPELATLPIDFVSLDVYEYPEVARRYAIFGIPHFLLFKNGKKLGKMSEFRGNDFWLAVVREQALGSDAVAGTARS